MKKINLIPKLSAKSAKLRVSQAQRAKLQRAFTFKTFLLILALGFFVGEVGQAQTDSQKNMKKSEDSRDYLIEKLNRVTLNLAPNDPSKNGIILRLADLLSDRARQNTILTIDGKCKGCVSPEADRKKALIYYAEALPKLSEANKAKVLVQMGHLNQLLGHEKTALEIYSKLSMESSDPVGKAEAYLAIAEIFFKKSDWRSAEVNYEKSITAGTAPSKGYAIYRMSWALFNQGKVAQAKESFLTVLKTPAYLSKSGSTEVVVDAAFHQQVAHDYAEIAGRDFKDQDLKNIMELSPEKRRLDNIFIVASDLERNSKKAEAIRAWTFLYQNQPMAQDRAVSKAHLGVVKLELGQNSEAVEDFNESFLLISQIKSQFPNEAEDTRRMIRAAIVTWNQAEKKNPSPELLQTYQAYLSHFPFEKEMNQWAVQIASDLKKWDVAWGLHSQATEKLATSPRDSGATPVKKVSGKEALRDTAQDFENHLLLGVELGEASKDAKILREAQDQYLAQSAAKTKYWEVFYQIAYAGYEKAENEDFLKSLSTIVYAKAAPADLRIKSGDLYLDYLATKKRDADIEAGARQFHLALAGTKGYQSDWGKIAEKAVLTQVAQLVSSGQVDAAWVKLAAFQTKNADEKDVATFHKNRIIIAEKRGDITAALASAKDLKGAPHATREDQEFAQAKLAYYSDLKMDFKAAMTFTAQLPDSILAADKKNLKLALYSDLLGQNSSPYLKKFIENSKDQSAKEMAIFEVVKSSGNMDDEIKRNEKLLSPNRTLMGEVAAWSYVKNSAQSYGAALVKKHGDLKATPSGSLVYKDMTLKNLSALATSLEKMVLDNDTSKKDHQKKLAKGIQDRAKALTQLDQMAADAIKSKDWSLQVFSLGTIAKESERFYTEIQSLPMPDKLTPEEEAEYMRLLSEQANPFRIKSEQAKTKLNEFWADPNWPAALTARLNGAFAPLARYECEQLERVADDKVKATLVSLGATKNSAVVSGSQSSTSLNAAGANEAGISAQVEVARTEVKNEPLNIVKVQNLKDLETKAGNRAMIQYLEGRINEMSLAKNSDSKVKDDSKGVQ